MGEMTQAGDKAPTGRWFGFRCDHNSCAHYGVCLVGPPIPSPPPAPRNRPDSPTTEADL